MKSVGLIIFVALAGLLVSAGLILLRKNLKQNAAVIAATSTKKRPAKKKHASKKNTKNADVRRPQENEEEEDRDERPQPPDPIEETFGGKMEPKVVSLSEADNSGWTYVQKKSQSQSFANKQAKAALLAKKSEEERLAQQRLEKKRRRRQVEKEKERFARELQRTQDF
eukprot:CAMPEP_0198723276 /NCGR_PEP_ID=MMETSP1475-20131203/812_1 /TAXON_ID= ORGANISM="Unidentified sp., Strain CCMP1999" /NCGR_SAMPLE_ID=MMETSP1475 /ASSEMBLY_ACC=CAM_ASM_001111 /LENGTH=167 /DNA_ID=CAMNT_0044484353 /DNA_START=97 /DNA_END=600 /DNA_ORIENTATION=-